MIATLTQLEPREALSQETLYQELDVVQEICFFQKGAVDLGYEINKKKMYKLRLKKNLVLGAFYTTFDRRAMYTVKASQDCSGFQIRWLKWNKVLSSFPEISKTIKRKILEDFYRNVNRPMKLQRKRDVDIYLQNNKGRYSKDLCKDVEKQSNDYFELLTQIFSGGKDRLFDEEQQLKDELQDTLNTYK